MIKNCTICSKEIIKKSCESVSYWTTKKFCSYECYWNDKQGKFPSHLKPIEKGVHASPLTEFKKGQPSIWKGKKQPRTKEQYEKRVAALAKGEHHWNWRGGINPLNDTARKSLEYKIWHSACLARDGYTCQISGESRSPLVVHHLRNFSQFPELRFAIDNGITLGKKVHQAFHKKYGNKNNTKEQIDEFAEKFIIGSNI